MTRFFDFDAAWAERRDAEPVQAKVLGRIWDLPAVLPAAVLLRAIRLVEGGDRDLAPHEIIGLAADLVPRETLDQWLDLGIDVDQLADVLRTLLPVYMGTDPGEAPGPETVAQSSGQSSSTGQRSKPTSNASTGSS